MSNKKSAFSSGKVVKLKKKQLISFCKSLASMMKAGITLTEGLKFWGEKQPNPDLKKAILTIAVDIKAGIPAHKAFEKSKKFDPTFISLVNAGSKAGSMPKALDSIAERIKTELKFSKKLKKVTVQPAVIITILVALFVGSQLKLVPNVEKMIKDVGAEPDAFSAFVFKVSHVTQNTWYIILPIMITLIVMIAVNKQLQNAIIMAIASKLRILKSLIYGFRQMTFLGVMAMLYRNGIEMSQTLTIASTVMRDNNFGKELEKVKINNKNGMPLAQCFEKFTSCDQEVFHLIAIGEKSSTIPDQLDQLTTLYEEETEERVDTFTAIVSTLVTFIALGLIGFVFIGSYLPIVLMGPKMMNSAA